MTLLPHTPERTDEAEQEWLNKLVYLEGEPQNRIQVMDRPYHPLVAPLHAELQDLAKDVARYLRALGGAKKGSKALAFGMPSGPFLRGPNPILMHSTKFVQPVRASYLGYERALKVANAVLNAGGERGFQVSMREKKDAFCLTGYGGHAFIRVMESSERRTGSEPLYPSWSVHVGTGRLRVMVYDWRMYAPKEVSDRSELPLELQLNHAMALVYRAVVQSRRARRETAERERQYELARRRNEELARQAAALEAERQRIEKRRQAILSEAMHWESAQVIRRYVAHLQANCAPATPEGCAWIEEALAVADAMDPSGLRR